MVNKPQGRADFDTFVDNYGRGIAINTRAHKALQVRNVLLPEVSCFE